MRRVQLAVSILYHKLQTLQQIVYPVETQTVLAFLYIRFVILEIFSQDRMTT